MQISIVNSVDDVSASIGKFLTRFYYGFYSYLFNRLPGKKEVYRTRVSRCDFDEANTPTKSATDIRFPSQNPTTPLHEIGYYSRPLSRKF